MSGEGKDGGERVGRDRVFFWVTPVPQELAASRPCVAFVFANFPWRSSVSIFLTGKQRMASD